MQARSVIVSSRTSVAPVFSGRDDLDMSDHDDEDDARRAIGRRIAEAREAVGMSQEDLAERVGVRSATISRYERGAFQPRLDKLAPLASALGTSADWLFRGVEPGASTTVHPALAAFLATEDGQGASDSERAQLTSFRPSDEPTVAFYGALLLLIRSGMKRVYETPANREISGVRGKTSDAPTRRSSSK